MPEYKTRQGGYEPRLLLDYYLSSSEKLVGWLVGWLVRENTSLSILFHALCLAGRSPGESFVFARRDDTMFAA